MVHIGISVYNTSPNLRAEFDFCLGLAPDNGTEMWLIDADDSVYTAANTIFKHHLLLFKHSKSSLKTFTVMTVEAFQQVTHLVAKEFHENLDVSL